MSNIDYVKFKQLYNNKELMHHGVKGQKWGVRKDKDKSSNERDKSSNEYKMFKEQQRALNKAAAAEVKRKKKIIRTAGAILIGGTIVASVLINKHKKEKLSAINSSSNKGATLLLTNTMQNVGKDTYVDDLLKEAKRKSSTFRDMKDMLHHSGINEPYLEHFGILGQKWGVRRYQNEDGSLTEAGKERYYKDIIKDGNMKKVQNAIMENKHISNIFLDSADKYEKYVKAKTNLYNNVEKKLDDIAYDSKYDFNNLPPYDENRKLWADTERKWASEIHNKYTEIAKNPNIEKLYKEVKETEKTYFDSLDKVQDSIIGKNRKNMGYVSSVINFNNEIMRLQGLVKNIKDSTTSPTIDYVPYDKVKDMDPFEFIYGYTLYQFVD